MITVLHSLRELGPAFGVKGKKVKVEAPRKCPECGGRVNRIGNSNVWLCDGSTLEEKELKGKPVYVFTKCSHREIDPV